MKIAVGVDFSIESERAAWQAVELARHLGGEVVLVHVAESIGLSPPGPRADLSLHAAIDTYRQAVTRSLEWARGQLAELRERMSGQGPIVSQVLVEGLPDQGLCGAAEELGADLVVVGTHGLTGLRWFFLGSVAQHIVRLARSDVLVARGEAIGRGGYRRVLVATDFTPAADRALDRAVELAAPGGEIEVMHCWQTPFVATPDVPPLDWSGLESATIAELQVEGERLIASRQRDRGPTLRFSIRRLSPIPGVVHALEQERFDLVCLGCRGRTGLARALLGSVAEAVVRRAPCSVLIARAP